jgi:hypothetical protein
MISQALKSVAAEVLAAAKETPCLFFAPLVGAVRGAYTETVRTYSLTRTGETQQRCPSERT